MSDHHRRIRSFVRREGRMTPGQQKGIDVGWPKFGCSVAEGVLDSLSIFGRDTTLVLEIGFGMGQSLVEMAKAHPDRDYIGVEVHRPGVGALMAGVLEASITNICVYSEDVVEVLKACIKDDALDQVQIFFPDPWPKKRHHKRRLIQPDFVSLLAKKLKPNGILHLATDWENYAEYMLEVLAAADDFTELGKDTPLYAATVSERPETKFERRGVLKGHGVWDLVYQQAR